MPLDSHEQRAANSGQPTPPQQQTFIWWVIWFAILSGSIVIHAKLGLGGARTPPAATAALAFVGVGPLAISVVLRWLVIPRVSDRRKGLTIFVAGLAMAEGATVIATFLGVGQARDAIAVLGILVVAMWAPVFAERILASDTGTGPGR